MPETPVLDLLPLWALSIVIFVVNLMFDEFGFHLGRLRSKQTGRESDSIVSTVVGAQLGLLAFLLAFSFGIVAQRADVRRNIVVDEANAIGTAFLRAAMLPDAQATPVRRLLREYTDLRIQGLSTAGVTQVLIRSDQIHTQLWNEAVAAAAADPRSVPTGLFIDALNSVIDLHSSRVMAALRSRLPTVLWLVLFSVGFLSFFTIGYQNGLSAPARSPAALALAFAFGAVLWLVADIDRPGEGFLRVSQAPMIDLRKSMGSD
jgi:hypothetical protein